MEYIRRLVSLGYLPQDAIRICSIKARSTDPWHQPKTHRSLLAKTDHTGPRAGYTCRCRDIALGRIDFADRVCFILELDMIW